MGANAHSRPFRSHRWVAYPCAPLDQKVMTTSAYAPLTQAQQIFKDLIWNPLIRAGETYIEGAVPALALPVLKQLDEGAINAISDWLFNQIVLVMDVTAIKLVNQAHQTAYDRASLELAIVAQEKGVTSDEFKKARDLAAAALAKFTQLPQ